MRALVNCSGVSATSPFISREFLSGLSEALVETMIGSYPHSRLNSNLYLRLNRITKLDLDSLLVEGLDFMC
jgi:hypothetical protein